MICDQPFGHTREHWNKACIRVCPEGSFWSQARAKPRDRSRMPNPTPSAREFILRSHKSIDMNSVFVFRMWYGHRRAVESLGFEFSIFSCAKQQRYLESFARTFSRLVMIHASSLTLSCRIPWRDYLFSGSSPSSSVHRFICFCEALPLGSVHFVCDLRFHIGRAIVWRTTKKSDLRAMAGNSSEWRWSVRNVDAVLGLVNQVDSFVVVVVVQVWL